MPGVCAAQPQPPLRSQHGRYRGLPPITPGTGGSWGWPLDAGGCVPIQGTVHFPLLGCARFPTLDGGRNAAELAGDGSASPAK